METILALNHQCVAKRQISEAKIPILHMHISCRGGSSGTRQLWIVMFSTDRRKLPFQAPHCTWLWLYVGPVSPQMRCDVINVSHSKLKLLFKNAVYISVIYSRNFWKLFLAHSWGLICPSPSIHQ